MYWRNINQIGKIKSLRVSYIILFIIPIIAKLTSQLEETVYFEISNKEYSFPIELPFNWYFLYYSMIAVSIANIIYELGCPIFIKSFNDYSTFLNSGRNEQYLYSTLTKILGNNNFTIESFKKEIKAKKLKYEVNDDILEEFFNLATRKINPTIFWVTYDIANKKYCFLRICCIFLYSLGFVGLLLIVVQKFIYVTQSI